MRRIAPSFVVAFCLVNASVSATAATYYTAIEGARLLSMCRQSSAFCIGYIVGTMDAFALGRATGQWKTDVDYCAPKHPTGGEVEHIVLEYLQKARINGHLDMNSTSLIVYALADAWPCY